MDNTYFFLKLDRYKTLFDYIFIHHHCFSYINSNIYLYKIDRFFSFKYYTFFVIFIFCLILDIIIFFPFLIILLLWTLLITIKKINNYIYDQNIPYYF